jgi:transposase-like protein
MLVDTKKVFINIFSFIINILLPRKNRGGEIMGRPKGKTSSYRFWTAQEKYNIIKPIIGGEKSASQQGIELKLSGGMLIKWVHQYQEGGIEALENKRKPGNPLAKYLHRKELSYVEQLEYENMKLRIENERLKKGYTSKEADQAKQKKQSKKNLK